MTFVPTPWRWVHLALDLGIVVTCLFMVRAAFGRFGSKPKAVVLALGGAAGLLPWCALGLAWGGILGLSLVARALWTGATVAAPIATGFIAYRERRAAWALPAVLLLALKLAGEVWEPSRLEVLRTVVPVAGLRSPVRIAHFADLQTDGLRRMEFDARDAANAFHPDLVTFSGDVLNHPALTADVFDYLRGYQARVAKLFVPGDVDGGLDLARFQRETGFEVIGGKTRAVEAGGTRVAVIGLDLYDYLRGPRYIDGLVGEAGKAPVRLAMSHRPDAAFALAGKGVPLLFAGHTHGGQLQIPFFGPIVTLSSVPRAVAAGGVHELLGQTVVLARGFGWEGHVAPRVRLFCRPQLILLELVPADPPARS
ncbi:MAG: metallophosphoesterase [Elusimicrobia bacterium]|nr:metallophosphoesterase [Elusimicrobiota bacterium]